MLDSNTYCFTNKSDKKVEYMAIVMIEECWDGNSAMTPQESLNIYVHLEELIALNGVPLGNYELLLEN